MTKDSGSDWQRTYLAVSVLLGERASDAFASIESPFPQLETLLRSLTADERSRRARALAAELARLGCELGGLGP